jgi:hypothetical protein
MNIDGSTWEKWRAPYDPRQVNGTTVSEDEFGRMAETADCGISCPGCGICCLGYRDPVSDEYQGVEEFNLNLKAISQRGRIVDLGENCIYRGTHCDPKCPGYGRCCRPNELRVYPRNVKQARDILLDLNDATRWEIEGALLRLAHEGTDEAVEVLGQFQPKAHTRLVGFAECALEEGRYFNTIPRSEEERVLMLKREVLRQCEERICQAEAEMNENVLPEIERLKYELEVVRRVKGKFIGKPVDVDWQAQADALEMQIGTHQEKLEELRGEIYRNESILAEIERDIGEENK